MSASELCMDIIKRERETKSSLVKHQDGVPTPKEICNVLDDYVIGPKLSKRDIIGSWSQSITKD